jgi:hypothetical protein
MPWFSILEPVFSEIWFLLKGGVGRTSANVIPKNPADFRLINSELLAKPPNLII